MNPDSIHVQVRARIRLDVFLTARLAHVSRNRIQRHIHAGDVRVDGRVVQPGHLLAGGETITLGPLEARRLDVASEPVDFEIVYEDADVVVVDKPAGVVVHPVGKQFRRTLLNGLHHRLRQRGEDPAELGIVHRLDGSTSGLVAVAKTLATRRRLSADIEHRRVHRAYVALVAGRPSGPHGAIDFFIRRDPARPTRMQAIAPADLDAALKSMVRPFVSRSGYSDPHLDVRPRAARTEWKVLRRFAGATLVHLRLETGRTHQIRVHAQAAGWPLLGDPIYGPEVTQLSESVRRAHAALGRPALHAAALEFTHPTTQQRLRFRARIPADLRAAIAAVAGC